MRSFRYFFEVDYGSYANLETRNNKYYFIWRIPDNTNDEEHHQSTEFFRQKLLPYLLEETKKYYSKKVQVWLALPIPDFLDHAYEYLRAEQERINLYYKEHEREMLEVLHNEIIRNTANRIITAPTGLLNMLEKDNHKYIKMMYDLLLKINHDFSKFTANILQYIRNRIKTSHQNFKVNKDADEVDFIEDLIKIRKDIFDICDNLLSSNKQMIEACRLELQREFSKIDDFPKYLANYMDRFIIKNGKNQDDEVTFYII